MSKDDKDEKAFKAEVISTLQKTFSPSLCLLTPSAESTLVKRTLYDALHKAVKGSLRRDTAAQIIGEVSLLGGEMSSLVVDTLCMLDHETAVHPERKDDRERLVGVLREAERFLPEGALKERMEVDTLGEMGVVKNAQKHFQMIIKLKTKLFYKQCKFNLLREETEGYAKLVTELSTDLSGKDPQELQEVIKSIIGYFNLDPNRVLDLILESFECHLDQHDFFVQLLRLYVPDAKTLDELLGFKLKAHMNDPDGVPASLLELTALLCQHGILNLDGVYDMLSPDDSTIVVDAEKDLAEAKEFVRRVNVVSTAGPVPGAKEDGANENETLTALNSINPKFGLLEALLRVRAWPEAARLMSRLPTYYAVAQPSIAKALQTLIHVMMDPLHRKVSPEKLFPRTQRYPSMANTAAPAPAESFEDFQDTVVPMLLALGPHGSTDPILLYKVIRVLKSALKIPATDAAPSTPVTPASSCLYYETVTLLDEVLLPSLSLTENNPCLAEEIWSLLRYYPYHFRYRLYGQWLAETYSLHPALLRKKAVVLKSVKRVMQRIAKENIKPTSRILGKVTHSSPGLTFDYILSQIQLYDNMINPVVDSLKYLSPLSFDVLGYSIIEALNNPGKDRTKTDATSISLWLTALSSFCGAVFKKYPIELEGILQYVANQLKSEKSLDLLILKEIVVKMGGIEAAEEMTNTQIEAMAGGELLRAEAGSFTQVKNVKKSSMRLKDSLIDSNLAVPLCLLMAQQRNCVVYRETEDSHLKLVGKLFDQCQDTLVQFGVFLASSMSIDDYTRRLPPLGDLLSRFHVNMDLSFFIARPMFNHMINEKYEGIKQADRTAWKALTDEQRTQHYVEATQQVMIPVTEAVRPLQSPKIWEDISPSFLTTFWSLTMYDLFVPEDVYAVEIGKLKAAPAKVDENRDLNSARKKKEKERLGALLDRLLEERARQREHVSQVMARLKAEKDGWFFSRAAKLAKNETITSFLQLSLFPRCVFTANDAVYCAKFVKVIHMLKTPNFSTLICFDRIFCDVTYTVTSCTENEAHRYGRFLAAMLEIVMKWHGSKEEFKRECDGFPGFVTKYRVQKPDGGGDKDGQGDDHVDYENYRHVVHKWHYKIAKALVVCLESKDYVQIRNSLTVLFKILPSFPVLATIFGVIEKRIEKVCADEKDSRKDLYIIATSYYGQLKNRKAQIINEKDFHVVKTKGGGSSAAASLSESTNGSSSSSSSERKHLISAPDSRESSHSRSQSREKSASREPPSTLAKRPRKEKELSLSRDQRSSGRDSKSKDRYDMGPPAASSSSGHRRSMEPVEERDSSGRRLKHEEDRGSSKERSSGRDRKEKSRERNVETGETTKRDKRLERKRDRLIDDILSSDTSSGSNKRSRKDAAEERDHYNGKEAASSRSSERKRETRSRK